MICRKGADVEEAVEPVNSRSRKAKRYSARCVGEPANRARIKRRRLLQGVSSAI